MAGDIHGVPTAFSSVAVAQDASLATVTVSGKQTMASGSTLVLANTVISIRTVGNLASLASIAPTNADNGILAVWQGASGLSLVLRSGNTIYTIGASAVSAAAP